MSKEDGPLGSPQEHSSPFLFHCFLEKTIGKIVPVGTGRSQLLPSFWLLNGACVCFSEWRTKKCWNVDLGEKWQGGLCLCRKGWGLRNACALVELPKHLRGLGSRKGRKQGSVGPLLWCSCLEAGHVTSSHGAGPSPLSSSLLIEWNRSGSLSLAASCSSRWVPLHLSTIYLPTYLSIYLLSICLYPTSKLLWNISLLSLKCMHFSDDRTLKICLPSLCRTY